MPRTRLYLITPPALDLASFPRALADALAGGDVSAVQLRLKGVNDDEILRLGAALKPLVQDCGAAFIVNDSISLAKRLGADGVHLGQHDGDPREARTILGKDAQIGVTCHNSRHLAMEAGEAGADYVAFGAFYPTGTKQVEHFAEPEILRWWSTLFPIPCVAIGGITPANAAPLVAAGADFIAVSAAVWNAADGEADAIRAFSAILAGPA